MDSAELAKMRAKAGTAFDIAFPRPSLELPGDEYDALEDQRKVEWNAWWACWSLVAAAPQPSNNLQQASTAQAKCDCAQGQCCPVCDPDVAGPAASATDAGQAKPPFQSNRETDGIIAALREARDAVAAALAGRKAEPVAHLEVDERSAFDAWARKKYEGNLNYGIPEYAIGIEAWKAGRAALASTTAAEPVDANRLAMWLSASMDQHSRAGEMRKHIQAWLDLNHAAPPQQVDTGGLPG